MPKLELSFVILTLVSHKTPVLVTRTIYPDGILIDKLSTKYPLHQSKILWFSVEQEYLPTEKYCASDSNLDEW